MADQLDLFASSEPPDGARPHRMGHADIEYMDSSSILTKASGFMGDYDYTLNPYSGCSYGCTYCYAAFFARDRQLQDDWGRWVRVKQNALAKIRRMRTPLEGKRIYMSSVTDPYQPVERHLSLVRAILEEIAPKQPRLVIQTRSPLVTRDIDVLLGFDHLRVNMTVTTDDDEVRRSFEPWCPPNRLRLSAIAKAASAGIPCSITMTPLLPVADPVSFADQLLATGVDHFVVQPFHAAKSRFVAGTRDDALELVAKRGWDDQAYSDCVDALRSLLPRLDEGRNGFAPA
jgi:DNA repair photolyase